MSKLFISFIIPVYNVEPYLPKCLDSIITQSCKDWEMILIDDGSPDNSGAICDEYAATDSRIKVIHQENQGVAVARNRGLEVATGKWIWFVDSDDYITEGSIEILYNAAFSHDCDTIFFGLLNDYNGEIQESNNRKEIVGLEKKVFLDNVFCYTNPSMLFSREIFEENEIRFTPGIKMAEDLEVQYKYLLFSKKQIKIADCLYVYQHREGSAVSNPNTHRNNMNDCLKVANSLLQFVKENNQIEEEWFSARIRVLLKGCIQSSEKLPAHERHEISYRLKQIIAEYKKAGYVKIADNTIRLAIFNINLYFTVLRSYYKIKGIR